MEQTKALQGLIDAADLTKMVEELTRPGTLEGLSGAGMSGVRLTLNVIREKILASHDVLAARLIQDARRSEPAASEHEISPDPGSASAQPRLSRPTLRASIERMMEKQGA